MRTRQAMFSEGHRLNRRGDFVGARRCFLSAYNLEGNTADRISAANMALKMGDAPAALAE